MPQTIQIDPHDNVAVAISPLAAGTKVCAGPYPVTAAEEIPQGHKIALTDIPQGQSIVKYGFAIGHASAAIRAGDWVHVHNVKTDLSEGGTYFYNPHFRPLPKRPARSFMGYLRPDGRAAVRNELWILPTVGCVNAVAEKLAAENQHLVAGSVEGLYAFPHPFGCSQTGDDHAQTRRLLARWRAIQTRAGCWCWGWAARTSRWNSSGKNSARGTTAG